MEKRSILFLTNALIGLSNLKKRLLKKELIIIGRNMKRSIVLILLIRSFSLCCQNPDTVKTSSLQVAQTADGNVKAFLSDSRTDLYLVLPHQKDEWLDKVLSLKSEWDTIQIAHFVEPKIYQDEVNQAFYTLDSCTLEPFKIDSIGINGIIIIQYISGHEHGLGETFDFRTSIKQKLIEIWNLERVYGNPEKLFSAKSFCSEKRYGAILPPSLYFQGRKTGTKKNKEHVPLQTNSSPGIDHFYNYNLKISSNGNISITNTVTDKEKWMTPDHFEGIYTLKNGKYIFQEK
jgi:hypothetical protein